MKRRSLIVASLGWASVVAPRLGRAAEPCPPPLVSAGGGTSASTDCKITNPGPGFSTSFDAAENPISQGGAWAKRATAWKDVRTSGGVAKLTASTNNYDDAYAYLANWTGNDYELTATVYKGGPAREVELLLRVSDTATTVRAYECLYNIDAGYAQIMRWNGPQGDFTEIGSASSPGVGADGNQVRARIVGSSITFWWRANASATWKQLGTATDSTFPTGKPGIGLYAGSQFNAIDTYGITDFSVMPL